MSFENLKPGKIRVICLFVAKSQALKKALPTAELQCNCWRGVNPSLRELWSWISFGDEGRRLDLCLHPHKLSLGR